MRSHYWTCSKFADWLRGTAKPTAATSEEWDEWNTHAQVKHNFRYWLAEEGLNTLQRIVCYIPDQIYHLKYYVNNRYVTRTHSLTAHAKDIRPGNWCDVGHRFLPCLFNELVDFVEVETAWCHIVWGSLEDRAKYNPPFWATGWFRWRTWRSPQAGLDYLDWAMSLTDEEWLDEGKKGEAVLTSQALAAKEMKELYVWWTTVYPNRPDPHDASGWSDYWEARRSANDGELNWSSDKSPELKEMCVKAHKLLQKIEADYEKENEEMMIRLIKIRSSLWT